MLKDMKDLPLERENLILIAHGLYLIKYEHDIYQTSVLEIDLYTVSPYIAELTDMQQLGSSAKRRLLIIGLRAMDALMSRKVVEKYDRIMGKYSDDRKVRTIIKTAAFKSLYERVNESLKSQSPELQNIKTLSEPLIKFQHGITLHSQEEVSCHGVELKLDNTERMITHLLLQRSSRGIYTTTEMLIDECLSEDYLDKVESNPDAARNYIRRMIFNIRKSFALAIQTDVPVLINARNRGYIFYLEVEK